MKPRLKILLSAFFCSPYRGGEAAVGWNVAVGLAKIHDVTVICGDLERSAPMNADLKRYQAEQEMPDGLAICHVQAEGSARLLCELHTIPGLWHSYYLAYRLWQKQALRVAGRLHAEDPFDIVHHLNIIGYREPGYLWQLGAPFFWGPLTGAPQVPFSYLHDFGLNERIHWSIRNVINKVQMRGWWRVRRAASVAARIWTVSAEDSIMVRDLWNARASGMIETGCQAPAGNQPRGRELNQCLKVVWSGLFQGIKALPLLLRALPLLDNQDWTLDVLGVGPEERKWRKLTTQLGLNGKVKYHGFLPRVQALQVMDGADLLVHSSVKEGTPHVVLEALSMGLPVVCHDCCGMSYAVTSECGIKIPLRDPKTSVNGFKAALQSLQEDPLHYNRLSAGALKRAGELTWENKVAVLCAEYDEVLKQQMQKS